jgi:hypothetical protein
MAKKPSTKRLPKLTDPERHKRFVEMAHEVEASENPADFEKAFRKVISTPQLSRPNPKRRASGGKR